MTPFPSLNNCTVAVIGLGYVGLPLAVQLAKPLNCCRTGAPLRRRVIGFDINNKRLAELRQMFDCTNETTTEDLKLASLLEFTNIPEDLSHADIFIVTVPTPVDSTNTPDLTPLKKASSLVGHALTHRAASSLPIVIYESTVFPGATEEVCVPIIERESKLSFNSDFYCGYSPERINPGDKKHSLITIKKVTSGSTMEAASWVDNFYGSIIQAGTHLAPSLKVAEAAKVIENTQRDLNIALVNELAIIFRKMQIDTNDVLEAAASKWNFQLFRPGLVGGHCIGVDPYYLTHKAQQLGYYPQIVLAGRRINDAMGQWVVEQLVLEMARRGHVILGTELLVLGLSFKENCPDLRNTRVLDLIDAARRYGMEPVVVDPWINPDEAQQEYGLKVFAEIPTDQRWNALVVAVSHSQFAELQTKAWRELLTPNAVLFDLKGIVPRELHPIRL